MEWFYVSNGQQSGPISEAQLDQLLLSNTITPDTLVWRNGLADWQALRIARPTTTPVATLIDMPPVGTPCAECNRLFPQSEMVFLNRSWVCAECKPVFLQRMAEGAAPSVGSGFLWRQNKQLILRSETPLPDRCVKCNAPANGYKLKRQLYWHPPAYYLLILVSLLIYIIVAIIIRKKALIHIGLCEQHRAQRKWTILGSWLAVVGGLVLIFTAIATSGWLALAGVISLLGGAIYGAVKGPTVSAAKIDKDVVWVKGAGPAFLEKLPEWSGP